MTAVISLPEGLSRRGRRVATYEAELAVWAWTDIVVGLGLSQTRDGTTGSVLRLPEIVSVQSFPALRFIVRLLPGQNVADVAEHGPELARHYGYGAVTVRPIANRWAALEFVSGDPLLQPVWADVADTAGGLLLGVDELGIAIRVSPEDLGHMILQGQTGSGKSWACYSLLAQLASRPDVLIAGCDPSGVLLRPFAGTRHEGWQCSGSDVEKHLTVLRAVEVELDERLTMMPERSDVLPVSDAHPVFVLILEEFAGLLRLAAGLAGKEGKAATEEALRIVGRVLAEGRKVRLFAVTVTQRADAAVVGGFARGQASLRLSLRVDSPEAILMLHPGGRSLAVAHASAPPGHALLTMPGRPLSRIKAAALKGGYAGYVDSIAATR